MNFYNLRNRVKEKYPFLIETYVSQYGEKYRQQIIETVESTKVYFQVTTYGLYAYAMTKKIHDYFSAIIDTYDDLGVDTSDIYISNYDFIMPRDLYELTSSLFPLFIDPEKEEIVETDLQEYSCDKEEIKAFLEEDIFKLGIFAFAEKFDGNEESIKERVKVLKSLGFINDDITEEEYLDSQDYHKAVLLMRSILKIVNKNLDKRCSNNYLEIFEFANELEKIQKEIIMREEKEYYAKVEKILRRPLSEEEKISYAISKNYFDSNQGYLSGSIFYFDDEYTRILNDKNVAVSIKEKICQRRAHYLEEIGYFPFSIPEGTPFGEKYYCDWYKLDFKKVLPKKKYLREIVSLRDATHKKITNELLKESLINDFEDVDGLDEVFDFGEDDYCFGASAIDGPKSLFCCIFLKPFSDKYNLFDIMLDHEMRHAVETRFVHNPNSRDENSYVTICGTDLGDDFENYNERVTQKLAVEGANMRWQKGQYIFSNDHAWRLLDELSEYDADIDNLDIIFEPFREELISSQIDSNFIKIYKTIPKEYLQRISELLPSHDKESVDELITIRQELLKRKEEVKEEKKPKGLLVKVKKVKL